MNKLEIENENFVKKTKIEFIKEESEYHINVIINKNKCRFLMKMLFFFSLQILVNLTYKFLIRH